MRIALAYSLTGLLLLAPAFAPAAEFRDVLETPAMASALAPRSIYNGLARSGNRVVAVGQRGHVLYSDDSGRTWRQAKVPVSSDLVAVTFPTPPHGWAVGHDGVVLHSADAGATWTRQWGQGEDPFLDVWFDDERTGYIVGAFGVILHTADGGKTWARLQQRADNPKDLHLYAVRRVGGALYIAGEQGLLLQHDAQSGRFRALALPYQGTLFGITGSATSTLVFGLRGNAFRTVDGGKTWHKTETGLQVGLTAGAADEARLVLVSQAGHVLVSRDDGASFKLLELERPLPAAAVIGVERGVVIAGPRGLRAQPLN